MATGKIKRVLIANRGEIALRILRTVKEMSLEAVTVYEKPDSEASYLRLADQSIFIGDGPRKDYLNVEKIIWAAKKANADAIHPGYGFLAENPELAQACIDADITFIGPSPDVIRKLGDKVIAREIMKKAGIPLVPGTGNLAKGDTGIQEAIKFGRSVGYPLMIKASAGGGGRGIRRVNDEDELRRQLPRARSETLSAFNDDSIFLEKCIESPRHIEVQILADKHGNIIHLGTRDCSIQRRHQKLLEIAPARLDPELLQKIHESGVRAAIESGYTNAGTVEFLLDDKTKEFWFMEMNTRLQVEHTVTEELTGIDIVRKQILIAQGDVLDIPQSEVALTGRAIQVRINAEDPKSNFMPEGGKRIHVYQSPGGPGVRLDGAVYQGFRIPSEYDSLLVKMTVRGYDWKQTVQRLKRSLQGYLIVGPKTTIPFYLMICDDEDFQKESFDTSYLDTHENLFEYREAEREVAKIAELITEINVKQHNPYAL